MLLSKPPYKSIQTNLHAKSENNVLDMVGTGVPTDGTSGTAAGAVGPGSFYYDVTAGVLYQNRGTKSSPIWYPVGDQVAAGVITPANIIGTAAGQLGHANGVIMVPAAPTGYFNQLVSCTLVNDFAVAAYTAGGNLTVNIGGGGAALTGLIANTGFIQAAADKIIEFVPLAATILTYTAANSLNLVSSAAPTNPGTAAGQFEYRVTFRQLPTGL